PEATFRELKKYGFLGTANYSNVPMDAALPRDPEFLLRPYTSRFGTFLSLSRYPAGAIPRLEIAIQIFLGNPLLFYGHEGNFEMGIGAFSAFADLVNQLQPDTRWTSLGEIVRHTYLVRRRLDGELDVQMLASEMD